MSAASPYRSHPGPVTTLVVSPFSVPRRLLIVVAVILLAPVLLHIFLWSRVVTIRCMRSGGELITCGVKEESLALSNQSDHDATSAYGAVVRGAVHRSRGDAWIALIGGGSERQLTSGFNGDKAGQQAAAKKISDFLAAPRQPSVTVMFGSRWRTAQIFLAIDGALFLLLFPVVGQRLRLRADRGRDALEISRGVWPFFGKGVVMPLSRLASFKVIAESRRRFRLVAVTKDQQTYPLTWALGQPEIFGGAAERLNTWMTQERERHESAAA